MIEMNVFRRASNIIATGLLSTALCLGASIGKAEAWSLEEAAKPYAGVEIRTICDGYAPCVSNKELSEEFTERTGIIVNIEVAQRPNRERDPEIGDQRLALRPSRRDRGWHCARSWMVSQPSDEVSG